MNRIIALLFLTSFSISAMEQKKRPIDTTEEQQPPKKQYCAQPQPHPTTKKTRYVAAIEEPNIQISFSTHLSGDLAINVGRTMISAAYLAKCTAENSSPKQESLNDDNYFFMEDPNATPIGTPMLPIRGLGRNSNPRLDHFGSSNNLAALATQAAAAAALPRLKDRDAAGNLEKDTQ
jgi:hypothetical protein